MKSHYWHILGVILLTAIAFWVRFDHLSRVNFYNDEYYQFETAVGLLKSGHLQRYDFYTNTLGDTYTRASLFTEQVALSMRWFGMNETAARLPAVLWGTILIPLMFGITWQLTRKPLLAYTVASIITFDDLMVGLSRYVRMYSMLIVLCVCIGYAVFQFCEAKTWRSRLSYCALGVVSLLLSVTIFKELTIALLAGIGVYTIIRTLHWLWRRQRSDRTWLWLSCLGCIGLIFGYKFIPLSAIIIRDQPHWTYVMNLFSNWRFTSLAVIFFLAGIVTIRSVRQITTYSLTLSVVVITYFVFFSHRWDAQRYISFVIPWLDIVMAVGFVASIEFTTSLLSRWRPLHYLVAASLALLAGPWLSFPGLPHAGAVAQLFWQPAMADQTAPELGYADMRTAYRYVADHYQPGEIVLMQGPRFYYWPDSSIPVEKLGAYESLSLADFINLAQQGNGGWMIYNFTHQRHLRDNIKKFANKNFTEIKSVDGTLVHVYHFSAADVVKNLPKTNP